MPLSLMITHERMGPYALIPLRLLITHNWISPMWMDLIQLTLINV